MEFKELELNPVSVALVKLGALCESAPVPRAGRSLRFQV